MIDRAILHTDGGSRGNPGPSGIGYLLLDDTGFELETISEGGAFIGDATNNVAEYSALLWGLDNAKALDVLHVSIRSDSELMVKQIKGEFKVKSEGIRPLYLQVMSILRSFDSYDIRHVYRDDNSRADTLANVAMDTRDSIGSFMVPWEGVCHGDGAGEAQRDGVGVPVSLKLVHQPRPSVPQGTYTLTIKDHFDAAHALVGYPGECRELHGHTWDVEASVSGTELDEVGIVYDFKDLKADLASIICEFDHGYLNDMPPFDRINATAENLARVIYERLEALLPDHVDLEEISVWESPLAKLTYRR